jgi:hypothetical protein
MCSLICAVTAAMFHIPDLVGDMKRLAAEMVAKAFSSEVGTGSREENASNKNLKLRSSVCRQAQ